jgi:iron complex transport system permease protein
MTSSPVTADTTAPGRNGLPGIPAILSGLRPSSSDPGSLSLSWLAFAVVLLVVSTIWSLSTGAISISLSEMIALVFPSSAAEATGTNSLVFWSIRLPRVLLALVTGAALASAGAAMQGLFRNPLADPGLIGVSSGASVGVVTWLVWGASWGADSWLSSSMMVVSAFVGGIVTTLVVQFLSALDGTISITRMLLAGIAINALAGAWTGIMVYISDEQQLRALTLWSLGSVGSATWTAVAIVAPVVVIGATIIARFARPLNLMLLGDGEAWCLGVNPDRVRLFLVISSAAMVGGVVAYTGLIGFVGMVVPHMVRLLAGADHRNLLVLSPILGASLLVFADTLARTLAAPAEIPVGILTSLVGAPFFIFLLLRARQGGLS